MRREYSKLINKLWDKWLDDTGSDPVSQMPVFIAWAKKEGVDITFDTNGKSYLSAENEELLTLFLLRNQ